jgi:hypothetical protein
MTTFTPAKLARLRSQCAKVLAEADKVIDMVHSRTCDGCPECDERRRRNREIKGLEAEISYEERVLEVINEDPRIIALRNAMPDIEEDIRNVEAQIANLEAAGDQPAIRRDGSKITGSRIAQLQDRRVWLRGQLRDARNKIGTVEAQIRKEFDRRNRRRSIFDPD